MYIPVFQKNLTARQPWYHGQHQNIWKVDCHPPKCGLIAFDQSPISQWPSSSRFIIYSYNYLQHVMTHYIHIYIYAPGPATPPPPHGMGPIYWPHMISSPSPPRGVVGCGMVCWVCMVCMVGLVWHVWKVWYVWYVWYVWHEWLVLYGW